jgi:predicted RecB family nuclease
VLFWPREALTQQQTRLLAVGGLILARHQGVQPKTGTIVCGTNCTIRGVKLTNHYRAVQQLLDRAMAMASNSEAPTLRLNDHCGLCEFREDCHRQALESDDLSLLGKITEKQIGEYRQKGLFTVTALSYTFRARRGKLTRPKSRPRSLPLHALAIRQQRILVVGKPTFPAADVRIYFDAEGDPERKFNYLLGLLVVKDGQEQMYSLWADDPSQQSRVYNQFLDILGQHQNYTLYHYGTYESSVLRQMRRGTRRKRAVDAVMSASVNVLAPLFSDVYFPTYSNGLKDVAKYLAFSWTDPNASGLQSLAWRARWELTGDDNFKQRLLMRPLAATKFEVSRIRSSGIQMVGSGPLQPCVF